MTISNKDGGLIIPDEVKPIRSFRSEVEVLQSIEEKLDVNNDLLKQLLRAITVIRSMYISGGKS